MSILLPGLLLAYVGVQSLAERSSSLRATYTATTALVRDRLATELTNLESELAIEVERPAVRLGEPASARAWLRSLVASGPWLADPFLLRLEGGAITTSLVAGGSRRNPLAAQPRMTAAIREAEAAEFAEGRLEDAPAKYRQALGSASSDAARAFVLMRIGRTLFKLRRFEDGIAEYRAVLALPAGTIDPHGIPYAVNALMEIVDGLDALGRATGKPPYQIRLLQLIVEHPWAADDGYGYYLSRAVESAPASATELRTRGAELMRAAASIQWIHEEIRPRVDPSGRAADRFYCVTTRQPVGLGARQLPAPGPRRTVIRADVILRLLFVPPTERSRSGSTA